MKNDIQEYLDYVKKTGSRLSLYREISDFFNVKSALYPGSFIDIDPSLVIENVTYVDNFKGAVKFFKKNTLAIYDYLDKNKEYNSKCKINFISEDYTNDLIVDEVDLIISQYAGFVAQYTKKYLKSGGLVLANDSHGDASLTNFDKDFMLIGVINGDNKIDETELDTYFKLPKGKIVDLDIVRKKMKGLKYTKNPTNYIFRKR
ncbi:MAG: hypothetical protein PQJ49_03310 [Sphaerochaetaceae bacterium]|nr:hypothetical protein [Sphaerochaetaceae bacterium]